MPKFPRTETEVLALAYQIANGFEDNATVFPAPPVLFGDITTLAGSLIAKRDNIAAAKAASLEATDAKDEILDELVDKMKTSIRYAENVTGYSNTKLNLIGWTGRRSATPLEKPGQPPLLTITEAGPGDLNLNWKKPDSGGQPASYVIERRPHGTQTWSPAKASPDTTITLTEQPLGEYLEYRVVAMNRAGTSPASNTVSVVL